MFAFIVILGSCRETNTPDEFLNSNQVISEIIEKDKNNLARQFMEILESENSWFPLSPYVDYKDIIIDTIFYSQNGKMVFIAIAKRENKLAYSQPKKFKNMIEYYGSAFIAHKYDRDSIKVINDLPYHVSQARHYKEAAQLMRNIYFNELLTDKHKTYYNINDIRFWDSEIWRYPDGSPVLID